MNVGPGKCLTLSNSVPLYPLSLAHSQPTLLAMSWPNVSPTPSKPTQHLAHHPQLHQPTLMCHVTGQHDPWQLSTPQNAHPTHVINPLPPSQLPCHCPTQVL